MSRPPSYNTLRKWARETLALSRIEGDDITNAFGIGQANTTLLAEIMVIERNLPREWLDDETSILWDVVSDASEEYNKEHGLK